MAQKVYVDEPSWTTSQWVARVGNKKTHDSKILVVVAEDIDKAVEYFEKHAGNFVKGGKLEWMVDVVWTNHDN